jgi:pyrimidine operon attenuation protein/uracil phosphoribosyltransferase
MTYKKTSFKIVIRNSLKEVIFMERKVNVVVDLDGKKIVFVHDVIFKGKRSIDFM